MKNERGFTLIELLVVIAILAVLFGVTALALSGVGDDAESSSAKGEMDVVQTAMDTCIAMSSCTVGATGITTVTLAPADSTYGFGTYLRRASKYLYWWDSNGTISMQCKETGCTHNLDPLYP
ncbi:MAG: prepilin-type N-terminal cleavage/methylation domain-containing protein [Chloroflexota bacterium]|nr:prepilin-type N-terminal cleavage/methylation domain-containing protein [Chloroflexota bacterium]